MSEARWKADCPFCGCATAISEDGEILQACGHLAGIKADGEGVVFVFVEAGAETVPRMENQEAHSEVEGLR